MVLFALGLAGFCGLVALSVDVGYLVVNRRQAQNAADSAALAAIGVLVSGGTDEQATSAAMAFASENGWSPAGVTIHQPPTSGPMAGNPDAVEVIVDRDVDKFFAQVVYPGPWHVSARAVGRVTTKSVGFGVMTLNPHLCESLVMESNAQLVVANGAIISDSDCPATSMVMKSNATATADLIHIVGGFEGSSNYHAAPEPLTGQQPIPDPFAGIPTPPIGVGPDRTPPSCEFTHGNHTFDPGVYNCKLVFSSNTRATFLPGDYTFVGGMQLDSNVDIVFGRGIYVMKGGGFQMNSNAHITGPDGVLIYNTCDGPCGASRTFQLNSNASLEVKPYGAPYANISVWQDRDSNTPLQFNSNSLTAEGAIYSKSAKIQYNSNATVPLQFVADSVQMNSNAKIIVDVGGMATASVKTMSLVE